jgi:hypothetical protein
MVLKICAGGQWVGYGESGMGNCAGLLISFSSVDSYGVAALLFDLAVPMLLPLGSAGLVLDLSACIFGVFNRSFVLCDMHT